MTHAFHPVISGDAFCQVSQLAPAIHLVGSVHRLRLFCLSVQSYDSWVLSCQLQRCFYSVQSIRSGVSCSLLSQLAPAIQPVVSVQWFQPFVYSVQSINSGDSACWFRHMTHLFHSVSSGDVSIQFS